MLPVKMVRSLLVVFLTCVIALNSFVSPASANTGSAVDSFGNGFWQAFGSIVGGAAGTVAVCYAVNVIVAPFAPPIAVYLAPICPAIGGAIGLGGAEVAKTVVGQHSIRFG